MAGRGRGAMGNRASGIKRNLTSNSMKTKRLSIIGHRKLRREVKALPLLKRKNIKKKLLKTPEVNTVTEESAVIKKPVGRPKGSGVKRKLVRRKSAVTENSDAKKKSASEKDSVNEESHTKKKSGSEDFSLKKKIAAEKSLVFEDFSLPGSSNGTQEFLIKPETPKGNRLRGKANWDLASVQSEPVCLDDDSFLFDDTFPIVPKSSMNLKMRSNLARMRSSASDICNGVRGRGRGRGKITSGRYPMRSDSTSRVLRNGKRRKMKESGILDSLDLVMPRKRKRLVSQVKEEESEISSCTEDKTSEIVHSCELFPVKVEECKSDANCEPNKKSAHSIAKHLEVEKTLTTEHTHSVAQDVKLNDEIVTDENTQLVTEDLRLDDETCVTDEHTCSVAEDSLKVDDETVSIGEDLTLDETVANGNTYLMAKNLKLDDEPVANENSLGKTISNRIAELIKKSKGKGPPAKKLTDNNSNLFNSSALENIPPELCAEEDKTTTPKITDLQPSEIPKPISEHNTFKPTELKTAAISDVKTCEIKPVTALGMKTNEIKPPDAKVHEIKPPSLPDTKVHEIKPPSLPDTKVHEIKPPSLSDTKVREIKPPTVTDAKPSNHLSLDFSQVRAAISKKIRNEEQKTLPLTPEELPSPFGNTQKNVCCSCSGSEKEKISTQPLENAKKIVGENISNVDLNMPTLVRVDEQKSIEPVNKSIVDYLPDKQCHILIAINASEATSEISLLNNIKKCVTECLSTVEKRRASAEKMAESCSSDGGDSNIVLCHSSVGTSSSSATSPSLISADNLSSSVILSDVEKVVSNHLKTTSASESCTNPCDRLETLQSGESLQRSEKEQNDAQNKSVRTRTNSKDSANQTDYLENQNPPNISEINTEHNYSENRNFAKPSAVDTEKEIILESAKPRSVFPVSPEKVHSNSISDKPDFEFSHSEKSENQKLKVSCTESSEMILDDTMPDDTTCENVIIESLSVIPENSENNASDPCKACEKSESLELTQNGHPESLRALLENNVCQSKSDCSSTIVNSCKESCLLSSKDPAICIQPVMTETGPDVADFEENISEIASSICGTPPHLDSLTDEVDRIITRLPVLTKDLSPDAKTCSALLPSSLVPHSPPAAKSPSTCLPTLGNTVSVETCKILDSSFINGEDTSLAFVKVPDLNVNSSSKSSDLENSTDILLESTKVYTSPEKVVESDCSENQGSTAVSFDVPNKEICIEEDLPQNKSPSENSISSTLNALKSLQDLINSVSVRKDSTAFSSSVNESTDKVCENVSAPSSEQATQKKRKGRRRRYEWLRKKKKNTETSQENGSATMADKSPIISQESQVSTYESRRGLKDEEIEALLNTSFTSTSTSPTKTDSNIGNEVNTPEKLSVTSDVICDEAYIQASLDKIAGVNSSENLSNNEAFNHVNKITACNLLKHSSETVPNREDLTEVDTLQKKSSGFQTTSNSLAPVIGQDTLCPTAQIRLTKIDTLSSVVNENAENATLLSQRTDDSTLQSSETLETDQTGSLDIPMETSSDTIETDEQIKSFIEQILRHENMPPIIDELQKCAENTEPGSANGTNSILARTVSQNISEDCVQKTEESKTEDDTKDEMISTDFSDKSDVAGKILGEEQNEVQQNGNLDKETILTALGLQSLQAAKALAASKDRKRRGSYTGTLKTVIKINKSPDKKGRARGKGKKPGTMTDTEEINGEGEGSSEDASDNIEYKICPEAPSVEPDMNTIVDYYRKHPKDYHRALAVGGNQNHSLEKDSREPYPEAGAKEEGKPSTSAKPLTNLVIPEKSSSFSIHPGRLCSDVCSYCFGKFGSLDTPCHVAQLKNPARQQKILEIETHLTADSCLCDACYRHVDRKANCPSYKPARRRHYKSELQFKSPCCVQGCAQTAKHTIRRKWLIKLKRSIAKKVPIDMEKMPPHLPFPLCSKHFSWVDYYMVCGVCKRRLTRNHMYPAGPEVSDLNTVLTSDGIPVSLTDKVFLCKLCRYFCSLRLKHKDPTQLTGNHKAFFESYKKRILHYNDIEIMDEKEAAEPISVPSKGKRRKGKAAEEPKSEEKVSPDQQMEEKKDETANNVDACVPPPQEVKPQSNPEAAEVGADVKPSVSTSEVSKTAQQGKSLKATSKLRTSTDGVRPLDSDELSLHASFEFREKTETDASQARINDWERVTANIQFDRDTKRQFQALQRPYGNYSSFFRHLVLLEKYWRAGDLVLSPNASSRSVNYISSIQNRISSFEGRPPPSLTFPSGLIISPTPPPPTHIPPGPDVSVIPLRQRSSSSSSTTSLSSLTSSTSSTFTAVPLLSAPGTSSSGVTCTPIYSPMLSTPVVSSLPSSSGVAAKSPNLLHVSAGGKQFSIVPNLNQIKQLQAIHRHQLEKQRQQRQQKKAEAVSTPSFVPLISDVRSLANYQAMKAWNAASGSNFAKPQNKQSKVNVTILPKPSVAKLAMPQLRPGLKPSTVVTPTGIVLSKTTDFTVPATTNSGKS